MENMRRFTKKMFSLSGMAVLLALTLALAPVFADSVGENDVVEAAGEAVEAGVSSEFVDAAIEDARAAGLDDGDIEKMLEDIKEAYEDGTGEDLNAIVEDHITGNYTDELDDDDDVDADEDNEDMDDDDADDMNDADDDDGDSDMDSDDSDDDGENDDDDSDDDDDEDDDSDDSGDDGDDGGDDDGDDD